jgi:hypothetical protein
MLSDDQKKLATTGIAVVIGCAIAWYFLVDHNPPKPQPQVAQQFKRWEPNNRKLPVRDAQVNDAQPEARPLPPPVSVLKRKTGPASTQPLELTSSSNPNPTTPGAEIPVEEVDPVTPQELVVPVELARMALGFVGADPQAEQVWYQAINDPNMPADARKDLIEDLNEDGFANPRQITEDDLPLIYSRIALIEQVAPDAMDDVNAAAFAEAYKDLVNMVARLEQEALARQEAQAAGEETSTSLRRGRR